jgi:hypothetical protein
MFRRSGAVLHSFIVKAPHLELIRCSRKPVITRRTLLRFSFHSALSASSHLAEDRGLGGSFSLKRFRMLRRTGSSGPVRPSPSLGPSPAHFKTPITYLM